MIFTVKPITEVVQCLDVESRARHPAVLEAHWAATATAAGCLLYHKEPAAQP